MESLQKLGVEWSYDPNKLKELHYLISIKPDRLKNPKQARKYLSRIIDAVSEDASKKGGLDHLTISVDNEYLGNNLQLVTSELLSQAQEQKVIRSDFEHAPKLAKVLAIGVAITGGLAGLIFGYDQMAEWSTLAAEYMNNASYLWAPIAGLTQAGISILGTAVTTVVGAVAGAIVGEKVASPCIAVKTPLARKVESYQSLENALSQAKSEYKNLTR